MARKMTPEDLAIAREWCEAGKSTYAIADMLGFSQGHVYLKLREAGVKLRSRREAREASAAVQTGMNADSGLSKICAKCKLRKPIAEFQRRAFSGHGLTPRCRDCINEARRRRRAESAEARASEYETLRRWRSKNQDRVKQYGRAKYRRAKAKIQVQDREKRYGITPADYLTLVEFQGNRCAICGGEQHETRSWYVDHDHSALSVQGVSFREATRGLLCQKCNTGIGMLKDDPRLLAAAIDYLNDPPARRVLAPKGATDA